MSSRIPLSEADVRAAVDTLAGGWLTMGPRIQELEQGFAAQLGVEHAIAVSSGTAALHLACLAAGAGPQASVVVSALAGVEAVNAPRYVGAMPRRADVAAPGRPVVDAAGVLAAATEDTRVVVASHPGGVAADVVALRELCSSRGWVLVEDATDALGAALPAGGQPAGTVGRLGCFSFAPGRTVGVGEGGMVVSDDAELAARVRSLRSHAMTSVTWDRHRGHADSYDIVDIGFNFRMDEPRAALATSRLARLDALVAERRGLAGAVRAAAAGAGGVGVAWSEDDLAGAAPQVVPLLAADAAARDALAARLAAAGVTARPRPDAFVGLHGLAPAPRAHAARERTLLVDLGAALAAGQDPAALGAAVAAAL